jgi:uncharacterized protein (TIGR02001 family)
MHMRRRASSIWVCMLAWSCFAGQRAAADMFGGSLALTSDYLVRGISRSDHDPALQLDLHYALNVGLIAGVFASNAQLDRDGSRSAELSAYFGYAWREGDAWAGHVLASYYAYPGNQYAYPGNQVGSRYNYAELDADIAYRGWLQVNLNYSPDTPRFVPYRGLISVTEAAAELNVQRLIMGKLSATGGVGYSHLGGDDSAGYVYGSLGGTYDLGPVSLAVSYADTTSGAKSLFYKESASGRWMGTVIWRF